MEKRLWSYWGPQLNPNWIPKLAGIRFRQLSYEEVKLDSEYYDLRFEMRRLVDVDRQVRRHVVDFSVRIVDEQSNRLQK